MSPPEKYFEMNLENFAPKKILHASGTIRAHGIFAGDELGTLIVRYSANCSANLATVAQNLVRNFKIKLTVKKKNESR